MLKKVTILFLILLLILPTFSGCFKKKIEDKIAEEITEGILEKVTGNEADIDIDDGSISMKGEDGSEVILGSTEWPKGKAIDLIPEFKHGTISYTMNSDTVCAINIEDVEQKDFENYVEEIKSLGYTKDSLDMDTEMFIGYYANSEKDNSKITLRYIMEQKEAMISISLEE